MEFGCILLCAVALAALGLLLGTVFIQHSSLGLVGNTMLIVVTVYAVLVLSMYRHEIRILVPTILMAVCLGGITIGIKAILLSHAPATSAQPAATAEGETQSAEQKSP
jgi:hypothetical protein